MAKQNIFLITLTAYTFYRVYFLAHKIYIIIKSSLIDNLIIRKYLSEGVYYIYTLHI